MILAASFLVLVLGTIVDAGVETFPPPDPAPTSTIVTTDVNGDVEEVVVPSVVCYGCTGGVNSPCGQVSVPFGAGCTGFDSQCYQTFLSINRGSSYLVRRGCWTPTGNETDYCTNLRETTNLDLIDPLSCETCTGTFCNGSKSFFNTTGLFIQSDSAAGCPSTN